MSDLNVHSSFYGLNCVPLIFLLNLIKALNPNSSVIKEFAFSAGNPSSIPGLRRVPGEGVGYTLQCSWASLVAQLVKNPPAVWET